MRFRYDRRVWAWCMYDWANSAYALTVMAGFFPVFFKTYWNSGVEPTVSTARLGIGVGIAGLCVALLSPILGSIADTGGTRKRFLACFAMLGILMTGALFLVGQGQWFAALVVFVLADIGWSSANLFYDSMLSDVADHERMDMVSSLGYSLGYFGSSLLFILNMVMTLKPELFGLSGAAQAVRISFVTASVWWLLFSIPALLIIKDRPSRVNYLTVITTGMRRLRTTAGQIAGSRPLWLFLLAYWFYIDGVFTFMRMAVDFGMSIGLSSASLMIALLVVQLIGFPAALGFGSLARTIGTARAIMVGIGIYTVVSFAGALFLRTGVHYMILACMVGLAQGGIQALSRSYFGKIIPPENSAQYFGFYTLVGRSSVVLGPLTVAVITVAAQKLGISSGMSSRMGMSSVCIFFAIGGILLHLATRSLDRQKAAAAISMGDVLET